MRTLQPHRIPHALERAFMRSQRWGGLRGLATWAVASGLSILPVPAAAGPMKNVVIVHGESPDLVGPRIVIDAIETTIRAEVREPVDFYIENVDTGRFEAEEYETRLADLMAEKYRDIRVDVVVSFGGPAVNFVLRERDRLFPGAPVLLGFVDKRLMGDIPLPPKTSIVYVRVDSAATVKMALRTYPATRRILVVGGTSRFDRGWQAVVRAELDAAGLAVPIEYDVDAPLDTLVARLAALPADTAVLYVSMTRDGADIPHQPAEVAKELSRASSVPVYGLTSTYMGQGILGGALLDMNAHGTELAHRSMQLLAGEVPAPSTTVTTLMADWREMRRFGMSAASLPSGTVIRFRNPGIWERFRTLILVVSTVLTAQGALIVALVTAARRRRAAEAALGQSDKLKGAILDSLPAHVAVVDRAGTIISVNDSWTEFAKANGIASETTAGPGAHYLAVCRQAADAGIPTALEALALVDAACRGERAGRQVEYQCDGNSEARWYLMTAVPLRRAEGGAVITHSDITARKLNEIALRESEDRFRRLADALPVAIWMSDADGGCTYFNRQWLEMTGRTLEQECGRGWLESVHPDDRDACMREYAGAFAERQPFSIDYRIRQHDGQYRWLMDIGEQRYGADGAFHGFVGGCIDITDRRDAEHMLRDLNRRLILAQEEERRRVARDLHDHLSQQLALLAIDLQQLSLHPPDALETLVDSLQAACERTADIASDVHNISHRLHPSKLEALGLVATIRAYCRDLSRQSLEVEFSEQGNPSGIAPDVSLSLFRIVEEALSNVARHSGASEAQVALIDTGGEIVLRVSDSGRGFANATDPTTGLGLVSMRERLQAVGGMLTIASRPGAGTTVEARVPRVRSAATLSVN